MKLTIIRGLPGSGKSTLAKKIDAIHFEADMYFVNYKGEYKFNPSKIKLAHKWCQKEVELTLAGGESVVVSNTFTQRWEMQPYLDMAKKLGAEVEAIKCTGDYGNIHGVPEDAIQRMRDRWED